MSEVLSYWPQFVDGLKVTIQVAGLSILGSAIVSLILGVLRSSPRLPVRATAGVGVEVLRGATVLIYLFWIYYALPLIPGAPQLTPTAASVLVLSLCGGAYGAEVVRAGVRAVPQAQLDAGHAIGLPSWVILTRIVLPQALTQIVPGFGSIAVDIVKWTSIVSFVGVPDVLYVAGTVRSLSQESVPVYLFVAVIYLALCLIVAGIFRGIEWILPTARATRSGTPQSHRQPAGAEA